MRLAARVEHDSEVNKYDSRIRKVERNHKAFL